mmetsp:Transcript_8918/g.11515  ORF Transcript_8918/g.11515 Transcript_8918/m.11515 type:complete len:95 (+) Transcript_8918:2-286(+)
MKLENENGDGALKTQGKEQYFQEWKYYPSSISNDESASQNENVIELRYINSNYLALYIEDVPEQHSLVLDVSYWSMSPCYSVYYVGGWNYRHYY